MLPPLLEFIVKPPAIELVFPVPEKAKVILRPPPPVPPSKIKVLPLFISNAVPLLDKVKVLSPLVAINVTAEEPLIVKLAIVAGAEVIVAVIVAGELKVTISPATGTPLGVQLPAVFQFALAPPDQSFVLAASGQVPVSATVGKVATAPPPVKVTFPDLAPVEVGENRT